MPTPTRTDTTPGLRVVRQPIARPSLGGGLIRFIGINPPNLNPADIGQSIVNQAKPAAEAFGQGFVKGLTYGLIDTSDPVKSKTNLISLIVTLTGLGLTGLATYGLIKGWKAK